MDFKNVDLVDKKTSIEKIKKTTKILSLFVAILGVALTAVAYFVSYEFQLKNEKARVYNLAQSYGHLFAQSLDRRINLSNTLYAMMRQYSGNYEAFLPAIEDLYNQNKSRVTSIQFIPSAKVAFVYPKDSIEKKYVNQLSNPNKKEEIDFAIKFRHTTVDGPVVLQDGSKRMIIRRPIFLNNRLVDNREYDFFWGFSLVFTDLSSLLDESNLKEATKNNLDYRLVKNDRFTGDEILVTESVSTPFIDPQKISFQTHGCSFTLELAPVEGYILENIQKLILGIGGFLTLVSAFCVFIFGKSRSQKKILKDINNIDPLTNLLNRRGGDSYICDYIKNQECHSAVLMIMDIDNFKSLNTAYGHDVGDIALKKLADKLRLEFGYKGNAIVRNGGDEFLVFLSNTQTLKVKDKIDNFAEQLIDLYDEGKNISFSISLGYVNYPLHGDNLSDLCIKADAALYAAKLRGKGQAAYFNDKMRNIRTARIKRMGKK